MTRNRAHPVPAGEPAALAAGIAFVPFAAAGAGRRQYLLVPAGDPDRAATSKPFTEGTGIETEVLFLDTGIEEASQQRAPNSPADLHLYGRHRTPPGSQGRRRNPGGRTTRPSTPAFPSSIAIPKATGSVCIPPAAAWSTRSKERVEQDTSHV